MFAATPISKVLNNNKKLIYLQQNKDFNFHNCFYLFIISGPEQAIFCGVTTVRLISTGRYQNHAAVMLRKADETDLDIATLVCAL